MKRIAKKEIDKVTVINLLPYFKFPHIVAKNILIDVLAHFHCKPDNLNIIFMGDSDITHINSKFLSHKKPTDVISFNLNESLIKTNSKEKNWKLLEAEIYIGASQVKRNSMFYKTKFYQEIKRVIIHGALHLVGFDDKNKAKRDVMKKWEDYFLIQPQIRIPRKSSVVCY
jgi:rRNA maturation RNase YbeY